MQRTQSIPSTSLGFDLCSDGLLNPSLVRHCRNGRDNLGNAQEKMIRGLENMMFKEELKDVAPLSLKERRLRKRGRLANSFSTYP